MPSAKPQCAKVLLLLLGYEKMLLHTCCQDAVCQALCNGVQVVHDALIAGATQPQELVVLGTV
jgi:hypothetical protein